MCLHTVLRAMKKCSGCASASAPADENTGGSGEDFSVTRERFRLIEARPAQIATPQHAPSCCGDFFANSIDDSLYDKDDGIARMFDLDEPA